MVLVAHNPADIDETYLGCLNTCFSGAWCRESYQWYLKRSFGGRCPDVVVVYEGGALAAGVGINYRQLSIGGHVRNVAILTGAWTLPAFRGRWHFSRLIEAAKQIAREKDCVAILSFVTEQNTSARVLRHAGAYAIPTRYINASADQNLNLPNDLPEIFEAASVDGNRGNGVDRAVSFHYASDDHWRSQFIVRVHPVVTRSVEDMEIVVEQVGETDRLQYLSHTSDDSDAIALAAIARNSQRNSRHLFCFTTSAALASSAERMGMNVDAGYIMILDLPAETADYEPALRALRKSPWQVQPGDRM